MMPSDPRWGQAVHSIEGYKANHLLLPQIDTLSKGLAKCWGFTSREEALGDALPVSDLW